MGHIKLSKMKDEIKKSGANKGKFIFFKEDEPVRVRFLNDFEEGLEIPFHNDYKLGVNVPCQEQFDRYCEYCEDGEIQIRNSYAWSVYDYESKEVKVLMSHLSRCTPISALTALYESYGTLTDRDYNIKQVGSGTDKTFSIIPLEKKPLRNVKVKPLSEQAILKIVDKAYPSDNSEIEDEEEEAPKKRGNKKVNKAKTKAQKKEVDEWDEDEEEETDYESMSAKELYLICKERDIECKPKKTREYYIDLLEESDDSDEWDEEVDEWDEED